ncbi:alpha-beta hydrolase superfamily lysophospholipase [Rhizobium sp. SG_E_25_P2]|uniref:alpha/beta hydrolase n=1 Tax=Rhizobium sp. SG_E_25_P2 TaxID=2879942 RepID=UPI002474C71B|nr:alpha/beta fold hydrolase [Rhizobium sp. SG_E_25_P2]MDH6267198.1 alpha-beta hydrolase superfamily lysophospholipase [Rhizobium sp. SG_E_25_P2]
MSSYSVKALGQLINLAGVVSPRLGGDLAFWLFCRTAKPGPSTAKEKALFAAAQPRMAEARLDMLETSRARVAAHVFAPIGPANGQRVLIAHGWGSRIDYLQALITGLREAGFETVGLDLPGHGRSSGRVLNVLMAMEAINAAWDRYGDFHAMIGHSFGGYCSAMVAAGPDDLIRRRTPRRLVTIGSPVAAKDVFEGFSDTLGFSARVRQGLDDAVERLAGRPIQAFSAETMLAVHPELPVLVLHAEDDKEVPAAAARKYATAGPHVRLEWLNGWGHRRIVSSPEAIEHIKSFVAEAS